MRIASPKAKSFGIEYYLTPENTCEMHGTDRHIEAFANAIREEEREACAALAEETAAGRDAEAIAEAIRMRSNAK